MERTEKIGKKVISNNVIVTGNNNRVDVQQVIEARDNGLIKNSQQSVVIDGTEIKSKVITNNE